MVELTRLKFFKLEKMWTSETMSGNMHCSLRNTNELYAVILNDPGTACL